MRYDSLSKAIFGIIQFIDNNPNVSLARIELVPDPSIPDGWILTLEWNE